MGFFHITNKVDVRSPFKGFTIELLHSAQCKVCPLNQQLGLKHPQMPAAGAEHPAVYMLGEAPGKREDERGTPFIGPAGRLLRSHIPQGWEDQLRWNNCVRTRPPGNRDPTKMELECCRPSVLKDVEDSKPRAIFGFGNVPLRWATGQAGILKWYGRMTPVKIGNHACWYFPMMHPSYLLHMANQKSGRDLEFVFALNLKRAFALIEDLPEPIIHSKQDAMAGIRTSTDLDEIRAFLRELYREKVVGFDYETDGIRPYRKGSLGILTVALAGQKESLAFPVHHPEAPWSASQLEELDQMMQEFLVSASCRKVVHQLPFEMEWSAHHYGHDVLRAERWGCSLGQAFILDQRKGAHSLDFLCLQYFGISVKALSNVNVVKLAGEPLLEVLTYNALDAKYHRALYLKQAARLQTEGLMPVYREHLRRIPTAVLTQIKGIPLDAAMVQKFHKRYSTRLAKLEVEIAGLKITAKFKQKYGTDYRPSAAHDMKKMLQGILQLPEQAGKMGNAGSTDVSVLSKVKHPIAKLTLRWRKTAKLKSTYNDPLLPDSEHVYPDGMLHPITSVTKVRTWRTSAEDPNYQNFPKHVPAAKKARSQIRGDIDHKIVSFDYAGIQARNVAMESKDKTLVKAFWDRYDIHADWSHRIVRTYPAWIPGGEKALLDKDTAKLFRQRAKNEFVFACFFGAHPPKLAAALGIPIAKAEDLYEQFWDMFPDIRVWQKGLFEMYEQLGYVTGLSGFRRHAPVSPNEIVNTPIQSDESIIVCDAWTRMSELGDMRFQPNMEIHDDFTFVWPKRDIDRLAETVIETMLYVPYEWARIVPIGVEMSIGDDWSNTKEVGAYFSDTWRKV